VKVSLGGIWKHSLPELSGGQRSVISFKIISFCLCLYTEFFLINRMLAALSLILSLLKYKPAPMYIYS
ncbi:hypothetical protein C1645_86498, partial [Glomus cerebriforme]